MNFLDPLQPDLSLVKPLRHDQSLSYTCQKSNLVMPLYVNRPGLQVEGIQPSDKPQFLQGPQVF